MVCRVSAPTPSPLAKKLGLGPGVTAVVVEAPRSVSEALAPVPPGAALRRRLPGAGDVALVLLFCRRRAELRRRLPAVAARLAPAGGLWVAWPKKSSGVATDLSFEVVQGAGLALGLVDNKVCSVDAVFTALRFVVRREDRAAWAAGRRPAR